MFRRFIRFAAFVCIPAAAAAACSQPVVLAEGPSPASGEFGSADAGTGDGAPDASLPETVLMCPVTTCTLPWATCPSSEFPCGTNLLTDNDNCGGCGVRCMGPDPSTKSKWTCVDGQCVMSCNNTLFLDCDNDPANGCETRANIDNNHCGVCGVKCPTGMRCSVGECVLDCDLPENCTACFNMKSHDFHCGTCGNACDPTGPDLPPLPTGMHYGCGNGECGVPKCDDSDWRDCNDDRSDGCEAKLHTNEHCNGCFDACPAGKQCGKLSGDVYGCLCLDDTETYCNGECISVLDNPFHCGACGRACPGVNRPHFIPACNLGVCGGKCEDSYADCDGLADNGCEVDTFVDNRNCGGCGNACLPTQVCFQGQCQMAPCDAGAPGDPTK